MTGMLNSTRLPKYLCLFCLCAFTAHAADRSAWEGYGFSEKDAEEARYRAIQDLAASLKSDVRSTYVEKVSDEQADVQYRLTIHTDLPILQPAIEKQSSEGVKHKARAILSAASARPAYLAELKNIAKAIGDARAQLDDSALTSAASERLWEFINAKFTDFERYRTVALLLGVAETEIPDPSVSRADIIVALESLSASVDSLNRAATLLTESLTEGLAFQPKIYVNTPRVGGSQLPAPFALLLREKLDAALGKYATANPIQATAFLHSFYSTSDNGMECVTHLRDVHGNTLASRSVHIPANLYAGLQTEPPEHDFESALQSGALVGSDLTIAVRTNVGFDNLAFAEDEVVELFVRANKPCRFFAVGYTLTPKGKIAYLLPLNDAAANDPNRFVYRVDGKLANTWFSLGKQKVTAPLGVESLQLFAFTGDLPLPVPNTIPCPDTHLDLIIDPAKISDMTSVIAQTRALVRIRPKPERAEANLTFVTHPPLN